MANKVYKVKYSSLPGMSDAPDQAVFTVSEGVSFGTQATGNCGVSIICNVRVGCHVNDFGSYHLLPDKYRNDWGTLRDTVTQKVNKYVKSKTELLLKDDPDSDWTASFVQEAHKHGYHCYILTDCVNRASGYRGGVVRDPGVLRTSDVAERLFRAKVGYTIESPISLNHVHFTRDDISLIRVWIWYPPGAVVYKTGKFLGRGDIAKDSEEAYNRAKEQNSMLKGMGPLDRLRDAMRDWAVKVKA